ncbi:MAG TPA: DUF4199 domain-containing protein [Flavobacterium sp.]|nr:DUF4199 domain-containing protein [Flavobacterium sp.]
MNPIVKKNGITFGIISGVFSILVTALMYAVDVTLFASAATGIVLLLAYLVIGVILMIRTRKALGGVMTFKEGFTAYFISALVGLLISTAFNYVLFNLIDPGAQETIKEVTITKTTEMLEGFNVPSADIDKAIADIEAQDQYSPYSLLKGVLMGLVVSSIIGLIFAAIFKKSPKVY